MPPPTGRHPPLASRALERAGEHNRAETPEHVFHLLLETEVRSVIDEAIHDMLREHIQELGGHNGVSVVGAVFGDLLSDEIYELVKDAITETAREHVDENLMSTMFHFLMHHVTPPIVLDVIIESLEEMELEDIVEELCDEVVLEFVRESTMNTLSEFEDEMKRAQINQVARITESKIVEGIVTEKLLQSVATHGQRIVLDQYCNRLVSKVIIDGLIANNFAINESRETTKQNSVVDTLHKDYVAEVGSRILSNILVEQVEEMLSLPESGTNDFAIF